MQEVETVFLNFIQQFKNTFLIVFLKVFFKKLYLVCMLKLLNGMLRQILFQAVTKIDKLKCILYYTVLNFEPTEWPFQFRI